MGSLVLSEADQLSAVQHQRENQMVGRVAAAPLLACQKALALPPRPHGRRRLAARLGVE